MHPNLGSCAPYTAKTSSCSQGEQPHHIAIFVYPFQCTSLVTIWAAQCQIVGNASQHDSGLHNFDVVGQEIP